MLAIEEKVGKDEWEKLSEEERDAKYKLYRGDCWQHLRNIIIEAMAAAGDAYVKLRLEADGSLAEFCPSERMEVEGSSLIRSTYKYFNEYAEYHFGRSIEFKVWRVKHHKSKLFIPFERALGNRQVTSAASLPPPSPPPSPLPPLPLPSGSEVRRVCGAVLESPRLSRICSGLQGLP